MELVEGGGVVLRPDARNAFRMGDIDVVLLGDRAHFFYEYARADRAHELRHASVSLG